MDIVIENLSKTYNKTNALNSVSLVLAPGIHGLLGPNGAGKTTLMRILATILSPDCGKIYWGNDLNWEQPIAVKKALGYLPQKFGMYKYLTVEEALKNVAIFKSISSSQVNKQVSLAMDRTNLTRFSSKRVEQLSGGMLQRLGIAQSILGEPSLLILDEPSVGLDPVERINLRKLLRDYDNGERIILISSHIVSDIESLCSNVTVMSRGKILASGNLQHIRRLAEGHIAETIMNEEQFRNLEENSCIINFTNIEEGYLVRYLSRVTNGENNVRPTLEDSYTYIIQQGDSI